jgi:hypothetical protein
VMVTMWRRSCRWSGVFVNASRSEVRNLSRRSAADEFNLVVIIPDEFAIFESSYQTPSVLRDLDHCAANERTRITSDGPKIL